MESFAIRGLNEKLAKSRPSVNHSENLSNCPPLRLPEAVQPCLHIVSNDHGPRIIVSVADNRTQVVRNGKDGRWVCLHIILGDVEVRSFERTNVARSVELIHLLVAKRARKDGQPAKPTSQSFP